MEYSITWKDWATYFSKEFKRIFRGAVKVKYTEKFPLFTITICADKRRIPDGEYMELLRNTANAVRGSENMHVEKTEDENTLFYCLQNFHHETLNF